MIRRDAQRHRMSALNGPFSSRLPTTLSTNAINLALERLRAAGDSWLDLTETNPTRVGVAYPEHILQGLADPAGIRYEPEAQGLRLTREAVSADYARRGRAVDPDAIVLTASTSEAYSLLFKLLCDPGDEVLVPQPSYPLFELLTRLDGVRAVPYRLDYQGAWWIDRDSLRSATTTRTRAVLVVSPNNPTGSVLRSADHDWLVGLCRSHELAVIADEVFADYPLVPRADGTPAIASEEILSFALGGLSKSIGLPQVKLGWLAASGPVSRVADAIGRLQIMADTYLSVSTPVQLAAPTLLDQGRVIRTRIAERLDRNLQNLRAMLSDYPAVSLLEPEGGWSAVLRVPATMPEEAFVLLALSEARVLVHPGYFFDFASEAFLVVSLLPDPDIFTTAVRRLLPLAVETRS
jgi:alanine-synthesizing transaminase